MFFSVSMCCFIITLSLESAFPMIESNIIPYFTSIIVDATTRAGFVYFNESSLIFAHSRDSGVFGISDFVPSIA